MAILNGGKFTDIMFGTDSADTINGGEGNDMIYGGGGNDILIGGKGGDLLYGGDGIDTATYNDSIAGVTVNLATNVNHGGSAEGDMLFGVENLMGSNFDDKLTGDSGDNSISGGAGNDTLHGGGGVDKLFGGEGNDTMFSDDSFASFFGGNGNDTADFSGRPLGLNANLSTQTVNYGGFFGNPMGGKGDLQGVENLNGTNFKDALIGDAGNNILQGRGGDDWLSGGGGSDTFVYTSKSSHFGPYNFVNFDHDTINDFTAGQDHIQLDFGMFGGFAAVQSHMSQVGNDTVIAYDDANSITLHNVQMANLHASDFMFV